MDETTTALITRVKEVLSEVSMGISQARVALSEAKDELSDLFDRLERLEAVNGHHRQVTEAIALADIREKEHELHPEG